MDQFSGSQVGHLYLCDNLEICLEDIRNEVRAIRTSYMTSANPDCNNNFKHIKQLAYELIDFVINEIY